MGSETGRNEEEQAVMFTVSAIIRASYQLPVASLSVQPRFSSGRGGAGGDGRAYGRRGGSSRRADGKRPCAASA